MSNYWKGFILVGAVNALCYAAGYQSGKRKGYNKGKAEGRAMLELAREVQNNNIKQVDLLNKKVREVNRAIDQLNGEDS